MGKKPADFGDREKPLQKEFTPVVIILDNLRSAYNTGNVFRIADAVRARRIVGCGYTPLPPHDKLSKTARGCDQIIECERAADVSEAVKRYRGLGYFVYGIETGDGMSSVWEVQLKFPAAFVFGNEALGISSAAIPLCNQLISLPCLGYKHSVNVGNCAAVIMYESLKQWRTYDRSDQYT
ncbi:MAG: TrmH family RNA methyltransferase [Verrucomicrobiota bacterium]